MASFNRIIMVGNLTRDPELKQIGQGQVCRLSIASNRSFKNKQTGAQVQEVCYIDVDVWGAQGVTVHQYLQKGRPVLVEGRLKLDSWKDAEGQNRTKHSIVADSVVFLGAGQGAELASAEGFTEEDKQDEAPVMKAKKARSAPAAGAFEDEQPFADDLPF